MFGFIVLALCVACSSAVDFNILWGTEEIPASDYELSINATAGDVVIFGYADDKPHSIIEVTEDGFNACAESGFSSSFVINEIQEPIALAGFTRQINVSAGEVRYFVCGVGNHCHGKMRIAIGSVPEVNECLAENAGCDTHCKDTALGYKCSCNDGYQLTADQHTCEDIPACELFPCDPHASNCSEIIGGSVDRDGRKCGECVEGFDGPGENGTCIDVDACIDHPCSPYSTGCTDIAAGKESPEGRICGPCFTGFKGDGETCELLTLVRAMDEKVIAQGQDVVFLIGNDQDEYSVLMFDKALRDEKERAMAAEKEMNDRLTADILNTKEKLEKDLSDTNAALTQKINNNQADIENKLANAVSDLESDLDEVETTLDNKIDSTESALRSLVASTKSAMDTDHQTKIDTAKSQANSYTDSQISALRTETANARSNLESSLKTSLTSMINAVDGKVNTLSASTNTRFNTVNGQIDTINSKINALVAEDASIRQAILTFKSPCSICPQAYRYGAACVGSTPTACYACGANSWSSGALMTSCNACNRCGAGQYMTRECDRRSAGTSCTACPSGKYQDSGSHYSTACKNCATSCAGGYYLYNACSGSGRTSPSECLRGGYRHLGDSGCSQYYTWGNKYGGRCTGNTHGINNNGMRINQGGCCGDWYYRYWRSRLRMVSGTWRFYCAADDGCSIHLSGPGYGGWLWNPRGCCCDKCSGYAQHRHVPGGDYQMHWWMAEQGGGDWWDFIVYKL